jgi:hypothetical protein
MITHGSGEAKMAGGWNWAKAAARASAADIKGSNHEHVQTSLGRSCHVVYRRTMASVPASAQQQGQKPNILFIMGDDIGWMQPSIYHRGSPSEIVGNAEGIPDRDR